MYSRVINSRIAEVYRVGANDGSEVNSVARYRDYGTLP